MEGRQVGKGGQTGTHNHARSRNNSQYRLRTSPGLGKHSMQVIRVIALGPQKTLTVSGETEARTNDLPRAIQQVTGPGPALRQGHIQDSLGPTRAQRSGPRGSPVARMQSRPIGRVHRRKDAEPPRTAGTRSTGAPPGCRNRGKR